MTRRYPMLLVALVAAVLLVPFVPDIDLTTTLADATVALTDTAGGVGLAPLAALGVALVVTRRGIDWRQRSRETVALGVVLTVALVGGALMNEFVVKPAFDVPRPNIEQLATSGVLGPEINDGAAFYASGDKADRRLLLAATLSEDTVPFVSANVRAHWIHEAGHSFPSGHATAAMSFAAVLGAAGVAWLTGWRRVVALWLVPLWAVAVVYSRPLLEVHTPVDVIAGTISGLLIGIVSFSLVRRLVADSSSAEITVDATTEGQGE
ncbi:MAG TPA: phosphatase PAP2 family protein [Acidimicrobiia bacterium]|jgi:phosphatidylglycerophosphatase B|nr:phosphatase PAP2 family protein [Acidimicrobiia bacterium]